MVNFKMNFNSFNSGSQALNLQKGQSLDLTKKKANLNNIILGGGWDPTRMGPTADLDLSAFLLNKNNRVERIPDDVIFFNNMTAQGISLSGDDRTGGNSDDGDDEQIAISLRQIPDRIQRIVFIITIFEAEKKLQTFGSIKNAYIRVLDADNNEEELARYSLTDNFSTETAVVAGALHRSNGGWEFEAIGEGYNADLNGILSMYN